MVRALVLDLQVVRARVKMVTVAMEVVGVQMEEAMLEVVVHGKRGVEAGCLSVEGSSQSFGLKIGMVSNSCVSSTTGAVTL